MFPEGPIFGTPLHPLEHVLHACWSNRSADLTSYRNQFFMKSEIDIEPKHQHSYSMMAESPYTSLASSLDQFLRKLDKSPLTIVAYRTDIQQFLVWLDFRRIQQSRHLSRSNEAT
jgi:hypothetical protein